MIIDDTSRTIFIHVPKCAGSLVRHRLQPSKENAAAPKKQLCEHMELGLIDYGHIPLFILRAYFPEDYSKVQRYATYAVIRDPYTRFPSSFSQYLKHYGRAPIKDLSVRELRDELDSVIHLLKDYSEDYSYLPYKYIHFQRQRDFIYDGRERLVDHVYDMSNIETMISDIEGRLTGGLREGSRTSSATVNETVVYRGRIARHMYGGAKRVLTPYLSHEARKTLRSGFRNWFHVSRDKKLLDIFYSQSVRGFVEEYYGCDIKVYQDVSGTTV